MDHGVIAIHSLNRCSKDVTYWYSIIQEPGYSMMAGPLEKPQAIQSNPVSHSRSKCWQICLQFENSNQNVSMLFLNDERDSIHITWHRGKNPNSHRRHQQQKISQRSGEESIFALGKWRPVTLSRILTNNNPIVSTFKRKTAREKGTTTAMNRTDVFDPQQDANNTPNKRLKTQNRQRRGVVVARGWRNQHFWQQQQQWRSLSWSFDDSTADTRHGQDHDAIFECHRRFSSFAGHVPGLANLVQGVLEARCEAMLPPPSKSKRYLGIYYYSRAGWCNISVQSGWTEKLNNFDSVVEAAVKGDLRNPQTFGNGNGYETLYAKRVF